MLKKDLYELISNECIAKDIFRARFAGDSSCFDAPGQFVDIALPGCFLRRPVSVCDYFPGGFEIIYKVVGRGTDILSAQMPGEKLDMLAGLGNGFDMKVEAVSPVLIGGGVGIPPLYGLAKRLCGVRELTVVLGYNSAREAFYIDEFKALGCRVIVATADGSLGHMGFVTDAVKALGLIYDHVFTCGPVPMLKAVYDLGGVPGQYSFEARMACGFGACMGCTIMTRSGPRRVCAEGPVFPKEELLW